MDVKYLSYGIFYLNYTSLSWIKEKNFSSIHKRKQFLQFSWLLEDSKTKNFSRTETNILYKWLSNPISLVYILPGSVLCIWILASLPCLRNCASCRGIHRTKITAQKKNSMTDFFSKCDQIYSFLRISLNLMQKSLMKIFFVQWFLQPYQTSMMTIFDTVWHGFK